MGAGTRTNTPPAGAQRLARGARTGGMATQLWTRAAGRRRRRTRGRDVWPTGRQLPVCGDLRPDPANPRRISDQELESLTRSIREFGLIDPIIARMGDKTVIGGHQRLLAARRLGYKTVPVVFVDLLPSEYP